MFNIFDGVEAAKATKWLKSDFVVVGNNSRRTGTSGYQFSSVTDPGTKADLEKAIRDVETSASRGILEYDKLIRELDAQRKSIKEMITEYKATSKLADIAILVKTDADVIANKIRVVEAKRKLDGERLKHLREERKLAQAGNKATDTTTGNNVNIINQSNGALGVAASVKEGATGNPSGVVSLTPEMLGMLSTHKPVSMIDNNPSQPLDIKPVEPKVAEPVPATLGDTGFNNAPNSDLISTGDKEQDKIMSDLMTPTQPADFNESDIIVKQTSTGSEVITVSDVQKEQAERIKARLANKDAALHIDTMMNYDYGKSLDAITTKVIPQKEKYFINPHTGEYWRSVIEVDPETGAEKGEITNAPQRSITHIGSLTCNPKHRTVIAYYYPEPAEYVLVDENTPMPKFYKDEWSLAKNEKFRLTEDQCNELLG